MRSSNNQYTSEKGVGALQDADAVTEVMIDVIGSTLDPSEKFGGVNQRIATLQGEESASPPGLGLVKRFSGNEGESTLKYSSHLQTTNSLEFDRNKALRNKIEKHTIKQLQTSRANPPHGKRGETLCSLNQDKEGEPLAKRSVEMKLDKNQEEEEELIEDVKPVMTKKMEEADPAEMKQVFAMNPAIVSTSHGQDQKVKGNKRLNAISPRTSIERLKRGDKERFKMLATRNFNDQVIINRKSFAESGDPTAVVN